MRVTVAVDAPAFPVPEDLEGYWTFDQVHAPRPLTPLSQEVVLGALTKGFTSALKEVGYPLGFYLRAINYFTYAAFLPHTDPHAASRYPMHTAVIAELMADLGNRCRPSCLASNG